MKNLFLLSALAAVAVQAAENPPAHYKGFAHQETLEPLAGLRIEHYRHAQSGLEIYAVQQPKTQVVAYVTAYNVGARFEEKGRTGLAHLFEHLMFRGTPSFPKPFESLSEWGEFNAFTSFDMTVYYEEAPIMVLPEIMKFESERMRKLKITKKGFATERWAVVSERKMSDEDKPMGRLYWELHQLAFDQHPYQTLPIGWQEDLDKSTYEGALDFYRRYYAPNRAKIVVVGDFKWDELLKLFDRNYGPFKAVSFAEPKIPVEAERHDHRRLVVPMKTEAVYMADATPGLIFSSPNVAAESLMCSLLADSKAGYLNQELVEKGLARSVSADCSPRVDPGLSAILVVGNPGVPLAKLEKAYDEALKGFSSWLSAARLEKSKLFYLSDQYSSLRNPTNLAQQLATSAIGSQDPIYDFKFLDQARKTKLDEVKKDWKAWGERAHTRVLIEPADHTQPIQRRK